MALLVPPVVVTVMPAAPAACAGVVAVIWPALSTVNVVAAVPPMLTALAPVKLLPTIVMLVPPAVGPDAGVTAVTVGAATNVNSSEALVGLVPDGVVTVTSTVPAACAGEVALIWLAVFTVNVAAVVPNFTAVAPVNPVPAIVTLVPPALGPELGVTLVTVGPAV